MKFTQMEYFLAVAEELNFTAAAKSLYISQPALSKQIALLEEELDTRLFLRNSRRVALTAAGKQFRQDLLRIREQLEQAKTNATHIGKTETMQFKIGCFDGAVMDDFLPDFYRHIQEFDSNIRISLYRRNFSDNRKALERDEIDLLFTLDLDEPFDESFQKQRVAWRRGALIYAKHSPIARKGQLSVSDFSEEPVLVLKRQVSPAIQGSTLRNLKRLGLTGSPILEMENFSTLFANLELGHGYTILTEDAIDRNPKLDKLVLDDSLGTWVIALWKKGHTVAELLMDSYPPDPAPQYSLIPQHSQEETICG